MAMIHRLRQVLLPNSSSSVYSRTISVARTAGHLPCSHVLILQRSVVVHNSAMVINQNVQPHYAVGYSIVCFASKGNGSSNYTHNRPFQIHAHQQRREFGSSSKGELDLDRDGRATGVRISTLLSKHLGLSRRQSERMVLTERVTLFGKIVNAPAFELHPSNDPNQNSTTAMKVDGKLVKGVENTLKSLYLKQKQNGVDPATTGTNVKLGKQKERSYSDTRIWLANKLKGELITEVSEIKSEQRSAFSRP